MMTDVKGDAAHLIAILRDVGHVRKMTLADWDSTVVVARRSRLLGVVSHRLLGKAELAPHLPRQLVGHLVSAARFSRHRVHLLERELAAVAAAMPQDIQIVLLKGAAYCGQRLSMAEGRLPSDLDLMVERTEIAPAEAALKQTGWESEVLGDYDQRYYRQWSHEIPPMRRPGSPVEIDLHHTITPITGRLRPDTSLLFESLQPVRATQFHVLHPLDQVLHAVVHLFQDSELGGKLRDIVDIDGLIREHVAKESRWKQLFERSTRHGFDRPLWYALRYCDRLLGLEVPYNPLSPPSAVAIRSMDRIISLALIPRVPGRKNSLALRIANSAGLIRYHWLRMPPALLAKHLLVKSARRLIPR